MKASVLGEFVGTAGRGDLARAALAFARIEHPALDASPYLARLDEMGEQLRERLEALNREGRMTPLTRIALVNEYLFNECGLSGNRLRQQGLSCPRRADQKHSFWGGSTQAGILRRVLEKVHDLDQLVLRLIDIFQGRLRVKKRQHDPEVFELPCTEAHGAGNLWSNQIRTDDEAVGTVEYVEDEMENLFKKGKVRFSIDYNRITYVYVVQNTSREEILRLKMSTPDE